MTSCPRHQEDVVAILFVGIHLFVKFSFSIHNSHNHFRLLFISKSSVCISKWVSRSGYLHATMHLSSNDGYSWWTISWRAFSPRTSRLYRTIASDSVTTFQPHVIYNLSFNSDNCLQKKRHIPLITVYSPSEANMSSALGRSRRALAAAVSPGISSTTGSV